MLMQQLADYATREQSSALPPEVIHHTKRAVIDWYASLLPGSLVKPAILLEDAFAEDLDRGRARLATGRRATLRAAALINGAASHSVEFDDIYRDAGYHPGSPVISAALAAAQASGASGERFLRGVIVGYEISTRIGEAIMPSHYKYWHTTGTVGAFGAAAAAATIFGADREQFMHALATVGSLASGLQQAFRSQAMTKPLHAGHAADAGCWAAMAAMKGVTGALDILEGVAGFGNAMSVNPDWSKATRGLGENYHIVHVTFKNHGCCGHAFPSIDGVLHLQREHKFTHKDVKCIKLATYKAGLDIINNAEPQGEYQAKFSIQYTVAHALVHGSVRLDAFLPDRLNDTDVRAMIKKIACVADPELSNAYPGQRAAQVEIELQDGRKLAHFQPHRKGDPEQPLTDAELNDKFTELAQPVLGKAAAAALLTQLWDTEKRVNVDFSTGTKRARRRSVALRVAPVRSQANQEKIMSEVSSAVLSDLAPTGKLRVGINLSNFLLTKTDAATGEYGGVAVDLGRELGRRLGVPVELVPYPNPGALADAATSGVWDVAFLAAEPQRAKEIDFTAPYVEIEATYLVPPGSILKNVADVDRAGVRIGVPTKSAYELYLTRSLKHAQLVHAKGSDNAFKRYAEDRLDALAGLRPRLMIDHEKQPGSRILDGNFTAVQQAAGTPKGRSAGARYLGEFIEDAKQAGLVAKLIAANGVRGLTVVTTTEKTVQGAE